MYNKYNKQIIKELKNSFCCFHLFDNRVIEGVVLKSKKTNYIDIGFKYPVNIESKDNLNTSLIFKTNCLETIFYDVNVNYVEIKRNINRSIIWSILKKAFQQKCFIKGRILNLARGGFSVGIYGFAGFLQKKLHLSSKKNTDSIFYIKKINYLKKTIILSQKNINKIASKILFKLSSKIIYVSKN